VLTAAQLPEGFSVAKETKATINKAAKIFILYLTAWYDTLHHHHHHHGSDHVWWVFIVQE